MFFFFFRHVDTKYLSHYKLKEEFSKLKLCNGDIMVKFKYNFNYCYFSLVLQLAQYLAMHLLQKA